METITTTMTTPMQRYADAVAALAPAYEDVCAELEDATQILPVVMAERDELVRENERLTRENDDLKARVELVERAMACAQHLEQILKGSPTQWDVPTPYVQIRGGWGNKDEYRCYFCNWPKPEHQGQCPWVVAQQLLADLRATRLPEPTTA